MSIGQRIRHRIAEVKAKAADIKYVYGGLIGAYGTDQPINDVHQLTAELVDGTVRMSLQTRSGDGYRLGITPDEARRYAARLVHVAHDA